MGLFPLFSVIWTFFLKEKKTKEKGPYSQEQRKKAHIVENKGKRPI
jgi:hypothetical protein